MAHSAVTPKDVAKAQVGVITTPLLELISQQAHQAQNNTISDEGAALVLLCLPAICDELIEYRKRRDAATDLMINADPTNVIPLRTGGN